MADRTRHDDSASIDGSAATAEPAPWQRRDPVAIDPVQYRRQCDDTMAAMIAQPIADRPPVQAALDDGQETTWAGVSRADDVHAAAAHGVGGGGSPLPHLDRIQQSFGHHDVGGVQAHVGGAAAEAAGAMGAQAYATGDRVAFASAPDVHLAAHEAAHVVQQRGGVQLKGGVGAAGDVYEQHADQVADAVVRGESAQAILDGGPSGGAPAAQRSVVQKFDGDEHKDSGDVGSGHREYKWGPTGTKGEQGPTEATTRLPTHSTPAYDRLGEQVPFDQKAYKFEFQLTHGDIVRLSGDWFNPRDTDLSGHPVHDSLFNIAKKPSSNPGREPGTQDEIIYALWTDRERGEHDRRFDSFSTKEQPGGGPWWPHAKAFADKSNKVVERVDARFLALASKNREHFTNPDAKHPAKDGPRDSAGGAFRPLHENAIKRAYHAARDQKDVGEAYAREAAAEHFLTDEFSAGHIRTPRASLQEFWDARYPKFWDAVQAVLEDGIVEQLERQVNPATLGIGIATLGLATGPIMHSQVRSTMADMMKGVPPLTFGDVMSKLTHDVDNDNGVWVKNDLGDTWKAFGDGHMFKSSPDPQGKEQNLTAEKSRLAVSLGVDDLGTAQILGTTGRDQPEVPEQDLFSEVRAHTAAPAKPGAKYGAEQVVPFVDPARHADNGTMNWTAMSYGELLALPVRDDMPKWTYGAAITHALQPGGAFYNRLAKKAAGVKETVKTTHPRAAFEKFLGQIAGDPIHWMKVILDRSK